MHDLQKIVSLFFISFLLKTRLLFYLLLFLPFVIFILCNAKFLCKMTQIQKAKRKRADRVNHQRSKQPK